MIYYYVVRQCIKLWLPWTVLRGLALLIMWRRVSPIRIIRSCVLVASCITNYFVLKHVHYHEFDNKTNGVTCACRMPDWLLRTCVLTSCTVFHEKQFKLKCKLQFEYHYSVKN